MAQKLHSVNPATGQKLKSYPMTERKELERMLKDAQAAFEYWSKTETRDRSQKMLRAAQVLRGNAGTFAEIMALEMGKPLAQGKGEIEKCAWACDFYAKEIERFLAPEAVSTDASKSYVAYEALGVVLAVMPWNFPFWQVFRCAVPALMAGNVIVLKHASNVPGCALAIEKVFKGAGFPPGLFQSALLDSKGALKMIEHPHIKAVSLTGSTQAGRAVAAAAGRFIKKTVLELGGSDPYVVLEDADLSLAADICVKSRLINGGQSCVAAKRFIVVGPGIKRFEEMFVEKMKAQKMGDPFEEGVTVGPLARKDLRDDLHKQVERSVSAGAKLLLGGQIPKGKGAYYPPTVLSQVKKGMPVYEEETFGPVAAIIEARDDRHAIEIANDSVYGLGAAVFTQNKERGERIAREDFEAGCVFVNDMVHSDPRLPFGGIKDSGYGRELSHFGLREFTNIKTVYIK